MNFEFAPLEYVKADISYDNAVLYCWSLVINDKRG
jgi:hypothetical protein